MFLADDEIIVLLELRNGSFLVRSNVAHVERVELTGCSGILRGCHWEIRFDRCQFHDEAQEAGLRDPAGSRACHDSSSTFCIIYSTACTFCVIYARQE